MNKRRFLPDGKTEWTVYETWIGAGARAEGDPLPEPIPTVTFCCPATGEERSATAANSIFEMTEDELSKLWRRAEAKH